MQYFPLMLRGFIRSFRTRPGIFIFFVVSGIASLLSFLLFYVNAMPYLKMNSDANSSFRFYAFETTSLQTDYSKLETILAMTDYESFQISTPLQDQAGTYLTTFLNRTDFIRRQLISSGFESPFELNDQEALAGLTGTDSPLSDEALRIGVFATLNDHEYQIIGGWLDHNFLINPKTFQTRYGFNQIVFRTSQVLSSSENNQLILKIRDSFPVMSSETPVEVKQSIIGQTPLVLLVMSLIYLCGLLAYVQILSTIVESMKQDIKIYRILGLTEKGTQKIVGWTSVLLNLLVIILGFGLHALLWPSFFSKISYWGVNRLSVFDYGIAAFVTLYISLMVSIPYALRWNKQSLNELEVVD